eukprot:jgi/Tetstr1/428265/TSEL_018304.t1
MPGSSAGHMLTRPTAMAVAGPMRPRLACQPAARAAALAPLREVTAGRRAVKHMRQLRSSAAWSDAVGVGLEVGSGGELQQWEQPPEQFEPATRVRFVIEREMEWGQNVVLVGGHPVLGDWNTNEGVPLDWVGGIRWEVEMEIPHFELIEYKFVVRCGWHNDAHIIWSGGPNSLLATNKSSALTVRDVWVPQDEWICSDDDPPALAARQATEVYTHYNPQPRRGRKPPPCPVPGWATEAIFYAIYPLGAFGAPFINDMTSAPVPRLAQIRKQYDHLQSLGVTAVYFSPLFESETHGYDTTDYFQIDRRLGDIALFKEIVGELHALGIRVLLDGVFNHTGRSHRAFQETASAGPARSKYANWYKIGAKPEEYEGWCTISWDESSGYGFAYDCWEGHPQLPQLNHSDRSVREHIFEVARFWLKDVGVDGWRLDVAHEISPDFWREFRKVCQEVKPDCLLVGEMIHGNYRGWVGGDRLHSGTNYQLARAMWSSLLERNYDELYTAIQRETKLYDGLTLLNFLSNHDVIRLASVLDQPQHYTLATASLMLLPGIPCFYYGDEFGVEGVPGGGVDDASGGDDALRTVMLDPSDTSSWPEVGKERLAITQAIVKVRQSFPVFTHGKLDVNGIAYGSTHFVFMRQYGSQVGIVAFNSSEQVAEPWPEVSVPLPDGAVFQDVWSPDLAAFEVKDGGKLYIGPLEPNSVRILIADSDPSKRPALMAAMPVFAPPATIASTGPPSTGSVPSPGDIRGGSAMPSA